MAQNVKYYFYMKINVRNFGFLFPGNDSGKWREEVAGYRGDVW